ncbi:uncharacterized protein LOC120326422 isoform X2 [Styela clava]|uniref:uncharacterized protein LOC120326422 isoform X2 n=1 Tax=Styela clava TaxID=7725 RepID=UPI00193AAF56|nr:uncharacterized protein LOC120326422 isoform X2 [Styela clava]
MNFKRKIPKMRQNFLHFQMNVGCNLQDSLSLIKRPRNRQSKTKTGVNQPIANSSLSSTQETQSGMSTLCMIEDVGLDAGFSTDSDSSIEETRDACSVMPTENVILPDIIINKPDSSPAQNNLEDTLHFNIKNSTMNQSATEAGIEDIEMQDLSPIKSKDNKKNKRIKLLDVGDQLLSRASLLCEKSSVSESHSTGNTPRHIKKVMNKLRAIGKKKSFDVSTVAIENTDINQNSIETSKLNENSLEENDEDPDEWSPTKMPRKPFGTRNWLRDDKSPSKYLSHDIIPAWKKAISKPQHVPVHTSFRTSSPSPYNVASSNPSRENKAMFQISSIRECDSDVSIHLNFESLPKHTINSDEIAPFSSLNLSAEHFVEKSIIQNDDIPELKEPPTIELSKQFYNDQNDVEYLHENANASNTKQANEEEIDEDTPVQSPAPCLSKTPDYQEKNKTPSQNNLAQACKIPLDIISQLPSPEFIFKRTNRKAPSCSNIPFDEMGYL